MNGIAYRPAARWLPSRSNYALFRLLGYLKSRNAPRQSPTSGMLTVAPGQNTFEVFAVAIWTISACACYSFAVAARFVVWPIAVLIAVVVAPLVIQVPFYTTGLIVMPLWRRATGKSGRNNLAATSAATLLALTALSAWFLTWRGWIRYFAAVWLVVVIANAVAAPIMWALRDRVRTLESECAA